MELSLSQRHSVCHNHYMISATWGNSRNKQINKHNNQTNNALFVEWIGWISLGGVQYLFVGSVLLCTFTCISHYNQPQLSLFYQVTKCDNKFSITAKYLVLEYQCNCEQNHTRQLLPNDPMSLDTLLSMQTFDIDQMFSWPFSHSRGKLFSQETMFLFQ